MSALRKDYGGDGGRGRSMEDLDSDLESDDGDEDNEFDEEDESE